MPNFRVLPGLPPYGAAAVSIPADWARTGREGLVVEFIPDTGKSWTGNFQPGLGGIDDVRPHPNGRDVLVISAGSAWQVDPCRRTFAEIADGVDAVWSVADPEGVVMSRQGLALMSFGGDGLLWQTRRISWDGFQQIQLLRTELRGLAWAPWTPEWTPFRVDLRTGRVEGGSYNEPDADEWRHVRRMKDANGIGRSRTTPNHCSASKPL